MQKFVLLVFAFFVFSSLTFGQRTIVQPGAPQYIPPEQLSTPEQMARITRSVEALTTTLKQFVDKWEKVGGLTLTEKQQKLILGMELLTRAEQRVSVLQGAQILLTEKLNDTRTKLSQVELDLRPQGMDRGVVVEGGTDTDERRDSRRLRLQAERTNLSTLYNQIDTNLQDVTETLKDAKSLASRLQRMFLPQIERELYDQ